MENTQVELKQVAAAVSNASEQSAKELIELQLLMNGGGLGEVSLF